MSAMVNEEMLAAFMRRVAIAWSPTRRARARPPGRRCGARSAAGVAAGLALLTKLSGVLATPALRGRLRATTRAGAATRSRAARSAALVAALVGGWFFARNRIEYGYFQPHACPAHQLMLGMPPGERALADYVRFPLATFTDPQVLNPELLRSVWGTTYASLWFDAHRFFLPTHATAVRRARRA